MVPGSFVTSRLPRTAYGCQLFVLFFAPPKQHAGTTPWIRHESSKEAPWKHHEPTLETRKHRGLTTTTAPSTHHGSIMDPPWRHHGPTTEAPSTHHGSTIVPPRGSHGGAMNHHGGTCWVHCASICPLWVHGAPVIGPVEHGASMGITGTFTP